MGSYVIAALVGLLWGAWSLDRLRGRRSASRGDECAVSVPNAVLVGAMIGVVLGAKLGFVFAEGSTAFNLPAMEALSLLAQGKTVTGGLLGGYAGVEIAKWRVGHRAATGDTFALIIPGTLIFARMGCLAAGCCLGAPMPHAWFTVTDVHRMSRWPAVPVEILFNGLFLAWVWLLGRHRLRLRGQLFHVYLVAYGLFRIGHETMRATPRLWGAVSGYQFLALAMVVLGIWRFLQRDGAAKAAPAVGA